MYDNDTCILIHHNIEIMKGSYHNRFYDVDIAKINKVGLKTLRQWYLTFSKQFPILQLPI